MKHKKNGKNQTIQSGPKIGRCPYCGSAVVIKSADGVYRENRDNAKLFICSRYPECDAYARIKDGTTDIPMSSMANGKLRALRIEAHRQFDKIYSSGLMSRGEAYSWLAYLLCIPRGHAHIGELGEHYCNVVIEESKKLLENNRHRISNGKKYFKNTQMQMASGE